MSAENAWRIAMEEAAQSVLSMPEINRQRVAASLQALLMPPAFRAAVEAEAGVIRADRAASVRLWQDAAAEAKAAQAETKRTSKMLEEAQEMLEQYQKDLCEGFCRDLPAGFYEPDMSIDCGGCRARALLSRLEAKKKSHE